jgi:hypothetical protein
VAHVCNSSYSGGRDEEDGGSKPAQQIVRKTLAPKNPSLKRISALAQGVGPEFKSQCHSKTITLIIAAKLMQYLEINLTK